MNPILFVGDWRRDGIQLRAGSRGLAMIYGRGWSDGGDKDPKEVLFRTLLPLDHCREWVETLQKVAADKGKTRLPAFVYDNGPVVEVRYCDGHGPLDQCVSLEIHEQKFKVPLFGTQCQRLQQALVNHWN